MLGNSAHTFNNNSLRQSRPEGGQKQLRVYHKASLSAFRHVNVENLCTNKIRNNECITLYNRFIVPETHHCSIKCFGPHLLFGAYACVSPASRMHNNANANEFLKRVL